MKQICNNCETNKNIKNINKKTLTNKKHVCQYLNIFCKKLVTNKKTAIKTKKYQAPSKTLTNIQQYIDHNLFKETLLNNNKPNKISFNTISIKNQKISTKKIIKNNIEFLNDKRYIKDIYSNIPHTLYIE